MKLFYLSLSQLFTNFDVVMESFLSFRFLIFLSFYCLTFTVHITKLFVCLHLIWPQKGSKLLMFRAKNVLIDCIEFYRTCSFCHIIWFSITWAMIFQSIINSTSLMFSTSSTSRFASTSASTIQTCRSISETCFSIFQTHKWTILNCTHSIRSCSFLLILRFLFCTLSTLSSSKFIHLLLLCLHLLTQHFVFNLNLIFNCILFFIILREITWICSCLKFCIIIVIYLRH